MSQKDKKKEYYEANREEILRKKREEYARKKELIKERNRRNYAKHKQKRRAAKATYQQRPEVKARKNELARKRRRENPASKLRQKVYSLVYYGLKKSGGVASFTWKALPYTPAELRDHLESMFDEKMSWENHGTYWHIDHIIPAAALPYDNIEHPNFLKCWDLSNLQPLEKGKNMSKGSLHEGKRFKFDKD